MEMTSAQPYWGEGSFSIRDFRGTSRFPAAPVIVKIMLSRMIFLWPTAWERLRAGAGFAALAALPRVEPELAADLLAFLRNQPGNSFAEAVWHGAALDELLQIRGMSDLLLFGADRNRNGLVSAWETSLSEARTGRAPEGRF